MPGWGTRWPGRQRALLVLLVVVVVAAGVVFLASPRHRGFFAASARRERARLEEARAVPAVAESPSPATVRSVTTTPRPLGPDPSGRIRVPLSDPMPWRLPVEGVPLGWQLKEFVGRALVELVRDDGHTALRLRSEYASFAVYRDVVVDLTRTPRLAWSWKVNRLPREGDVRARATDDQAAQVYVIFPRWPAPLNQSDVLGYVWDSRAPVDTRVTSTKAENVRIIVVKSGATGVGSWYREVRDVAQDYTAVFGHRPPRVGKLALMVDSNDTRSEAEALFGELAFLPPQ
jgi:hypothetical protein